MKYAPAVLIALMVPFAVRAQATQSSQNDPFVGTWKLNVAKSKFSPGPGTKSETVTITQDKVSVEAADADGKTENWSYTPSAGSAATITGLDNSSVVTRRVNDRTIEHTWKMGDSTLHGRGVLSKDGRTLRYTMTGTTRDGKPIHDVEIFEKQ